MTTTTEEKMTRCGFCLTSHPISEFTEHGLEQCGQCLTDPLNARGAEMLELYFARLTGSDQWQQLQEELAEAMSSDYLDLTEALAEGGEIGDKAQTRMLQIEDRAAHALTVNFIKRLMFATGIKIEDLLS